MKKGMSLIVLVITILVMIILAGVVVIGISNNNPIGKAQDATVMADLAIEKMHLNLYAENKLQKTTVVSGTVNQVNMDENEFQEMVASLDYEGNFSMSNIEVTDDPATPHYDEEEQNYYKIKEEAYREMGVNPAKVGYYAVNKMGNLILIIPADSKLSVVDGVYKES